VEAIQPTIHHSEGHNLADSLAEANATLSRAQIAAAHRAVGVVRHALTRRDTEAVRTVMDTIVLAPGLTDQIMTAMADGMSSEWGLQVHVDSFSPGELDVSLPDVDDRHIGTIVGLLTALKWWPSKVSVSINDRIAIDPVLVPDADQVRLLVTSVVDRSAGPYPLEHGDCA
jgi:hypothetical protein